MANNTIRFKRRESGTAGTPASLRPGEPFHNQIEDVVYLGKGTNTQTGDAQTIVAVAGSGFVVDKTSAQTISGQKTFQVSPQVPTANAADNSTNAASTAFVQAYANAQKGIANGVATLGGDGTLTPAQIPMVLKEAMRYAGTWDASTNTPTLTSGQGQKGAVYKVTKGGGTALDGHSSWVVGDSAVFNGTTWDKWDGADVEVLSVNGQTGAVVLTSDTVQEGASNLYFQAARVLSSVITGVSSATNVVITASDTILTALGKLQAQITVRAVTTANLSDLTNPAQARTNLGLGSMAIQNASAVAITGGTIDNIVIDGGLA